MSRIDPRNTTPFTRTHCKIDFKKYTGEERETGGVGTSFIPALI
jgi:hypothetical protein